MTLKRIAAVVVFICIAILLAARLQLALFRYVDGDEWAHLHWAYALFSGQVPYHQFFMNFTPLYFWFLGPLFLLPASAHLPIYARFLHFVLYGIIAFLIFRITHKITKDTLYSLLAIVCFITFPITFDKSIEIRQDLVMTALVYLSFLILLDTNKRIHLKIISASFVFGLAITVLQKAVFAIPAFFILLTMSKPKIKFNHLALGFIVSLIAPLCLGLYLHQNNLLTLAYQGIVGGSQAIKMGEGGFSFIKTISPYPMVYVANGGVSTPWYYSSALWILSLIAIPILLMQKLLKTHAYWLGSILLSGVIILIIFPTPYTQYFLPFTVGAAILIGILIASMFAGIQKSAPPKLYGVIVFMFTCMLLVVPLVSFHAQWKERLVPANAMTEQQTVLQTVLKITKPDETIYDMAGSYVYRRSGYYICCNIYSSFRHALRPLPPLLKDSLVSNQTKFIILDRQGLSLWRPLEEDLAFMKTNYLEAPYWKFYFSGAKFRCNKGVCIRYSMDTVPVRSEPKNKFYMYFPDTYKLVTIPSGRALTLQSPGEVKRTISMAHPFELKQAMYEIIVPIDITEVTIILDR